MTKPQIRGIVLKKTTTMFTPTVHFVNKLTGIQFNQ